MYIVKNAWKSMTRSKGRNLLIGIIVVVISLASSVALAVHNSANEIIQNAKKSFSLTGTITLDRAALQANSSNSQADMRTLLQNVGSLSLDDIKKYGDSRYLKGYTYTMTTSLGSSGIAPLTNDSGTNGASAAGGSNNTAQNAAGSEAAQPGGQFSGQQGFRVIAYSSSVAMTNFVNGTCQITSGSMFEDADTANDCVISQELANANGLSVGSTIVLYNVKDTKQTYTFTVSGIYTDSSAADGTGLGLYSGSVNQIITPFAALDNIVKTSAANADTQLSSQLSASFQLVNADSVEPFKAELTSKGLNEYYTLTTNMASFNESVSPLANLSNFATVFLVLVLSIGGVVLLVLNMLNIRERKHEIGVLRTIGMKKSRVCLQFVTELFMVTFAAVVIGTAAGAAVSAPAANYLLQNEVSSQQQSSAQAGQSFGRMTDAVNGSAQDAGAVRPGAGAGAGSFSGFGSRPNISYVDQINAVVSGHVLLQMTLICVLITVIGGLASALVILRYEPLKTAGSRP